MSFTRSLTIIFTLCVLVTSASAHGGHGGGFPDSGGGSPDGGSDPWPFGRKANEAPEAVRMDISELESERESATGTPELATIDRKLARARVRLQIAEKRARRDQERQSGDSENVATLEKEIDALKRKLRQLDAKSR